jgi:hypothetical protein
VFGPQPQHPRERQACESGQTSLEKVPTTSRAGTEPHCGGKALAPHDCRSWKDGVGSAGVAGEISIEYCRLSDQDDISGPFCRDGKTFSKALSKSEGWWSPSTPAEHLVVEDELFRVD